LQYDVSELRASRLADIRFRNKQWYEQFKEEMQMIGNSTKQIASLETFKKVRKEFFYVRYKFVLIFADFIST
jgi:hypothetical protein